MALVLSCILVLLVARLHPARQAEQGVSSDAFVADIAQRIPDLMHTYLIPGASMALVKNNEIVWSQAFGYADLEMGRRMTTDTVCRVQSISKPVTAWGIMKLIEQGEMDIDNAASSYLKSWMLPESGFQQGKITVRQLLTHTSGMPLGDILTRFAPEEDMPSLKDKLTMEARLIQEPGTAFSYSNTGYNLLELIMEEVTGRRFAEYMEREILLPLGMTESSFEWSAAFEPPVPNGYNLKGERIPIYVYPEKASGGLFATAEDIARFAVAGMDDSLGVLDAWSIQLLYEPMASELGLYSLVFDAYGLGYYLEELSGGELAVSHGGQGTGWMTHFHAVPETGDAIVILTNSQRSWPFIAHVLSDWAQWNGFSFMGMEAILIGQKVLWGVVWLICSAVLLKLWGLFEALLGKKLRFAPFSRDFRSVRMIQFLLSVVLMAGLIWCVSQPYLTISSIFPRASEWLGISAFTLALTMLFAALFPADTNTRQGSQF